MPQSNTNRWVLVALLLAPLIWLNVTAFNQWRSQQQTDPNLLTAEGEVTEVSLLQTPERCHVTVRYNPITNIVLAATAVIPPSACDRFQPGDVVTVHYVVETPTVIEIDTAVSPVWWLLAATLADIVFVLLLFWARRRPA